MCTGRVKGVSRLRVDTEAAAMREEIDTYRHPATASLLAQSSPVRLLADLVDFEPLGGRAVELVAGISCTDLSHNWTCVCGHYRKRKKIFLRQRDFSMSSLRAGVSTAETPPRR